MFLSYYLEKMFRSAKFQRTAFKVLIVLSTFFTFRLIYVMMSNHSLRRKDVVTFLPNDRTFERKSSEKLKVFENEELNSRVLEESGAYYIVKIWKKMNGHTLRDNVLRKSYGSKPNNTSNGKKWSKWYKRIKRKHGDKRNTSTSIKKPKHSTSKSSFTTKTAEKKNSNLFGGIKINKDLPLNCPNNTLWRESSKHIPDYGKCFPHRPTSEDCKTAATWYKLQPSLEQCDDPHTTTICTLNVFKRKGQRKLRVTCNKEICDAEISPIAVKALNEETGENEVFRTFSSVKKLEEELPKILAPLDYVFLECTNREKNVLVQLLPVPPRYTIIEDRTTPRPDNVVNVNIVLVDSVSRAHFYRSLPKTIQLFKKWNQDPTHSPAQVLDFELFQAVEGHTAENTHAMFTGTLFPKDGRDSTSRPVGMETLFGHFQEAEYQTMWQEDMCWQAVWGLFTDLGIDPEWEKLGPKLEEVHIESTGLTHASCEILHKYGLETPFNGPEDNKICFNGKFQDRYYLQHVLDTVKAIKTSPRALSLLSYMSLSVGHDQEGLRIQTFDNDLVEYATEFARQQDTLSIFLADHGNTYTDYTTSTLEGRFEMFHPSLFIVVPNKVAKLLGHEAMLALRTNQRRLVTMIDLHHTLMEVAGPLKGRVKLTGLFARIPAERTCNDVELRTPNLCVCNGWDSPTNNDTLKIALVEFAVGKLNHKLQKSLGRNSFSLLSSCLRLQPIRFENVRERNSRDDGSLVTSFDLVVAAGNVVAQDEDIFRVEIKSNIDPDSNILNYRMIHYERLSMFGKYKACADKKANLKLCVCNSPSKVDVSKTKLELKSLIFDNTSTFLNSTTKAIRIDKEDCIYLLTRNHGDAFGYEVANVCLDQPRDVMVIYGQTSNIRFSTKGPLVVTVPPGSTTFVFSAVKHNLYYSSRAIIVKAVVLNVVRTD